MPRFYEANTMSKRPFSTALLHEMSMAEGLDLMDSQDEKSRRRARFERRKRKASK